MWRNIHFEEVIEEHKKKVLNWYYLGYLELDTKYKTFNWTITAPEYIRDEAYNIRRKAVELAKDIILSYPLNKALKEE